MNTAHLTDEQLQQFAEAPESLDPDWALHISRCESCRSRARNYSALQEGLQRMEKPAFDFDLAGLVLDRLPAPKAQFPWAAFSCAGVGTVFIALMAWVYRAALLELFGGLTGAGLYLVVMPALVIFLLQGIAYLKEYKHRMEKIKVI